MFRFGTGLGAGGLVTASLLWSGSGLAQVLPVSMQRVVVVSMLGASVLADWRLLPFRLPETRGQVPSSIFDENRSAAPLRFGFDLGLGFRTYMPSGLPLVTAAVLMVAAPSVGRALVSGLAFGMGRWIIALQRFFSRDAVGWDERLRSQKLHLIRSSGLAGAICVAPILWRLA